MSGDELRNVIDSTGVAVIVLDRDARVQFASLAACTLLGLQPDDVGTPLTDVTRRLEADELVRDATAVLEGLHGVDREVAAGDGGHFLVRLRPYRSAEESVDGVVMTFVETGASGRGEGTRRAEELYRSLFDSIDEGFCLMQMIFDDDGVPVDYRFVETNKVFEELTGLRDALGRTALELVPDLERKWIDMYAAVALTGESARFEDDSVPMGRYFDVYASAFGPERLVAVVFRDITARRRHEANQALLVRIGDDLHRLAGPDEIVRTVGARLGKHLDLNAVLFFDIDYRADAGVVNHAWTAGQRPYEREYRITEHMTDAFVAAQRAGELIVVNDSADDPVARAGPLLELGIGSLICIPYLQDGMWMASVVLTAAEPREWRPDEIEVARGVSDRLFPRIARARAEAALVSLNERLEDEVEQRTEALLKSRTRFQSAFEAGPTASVITSLDDDRFLEVNTAFTDMTGYTLDEVKGRSAAELGMWSSEDDRTRIAAAARGGTGFRHVEASLRTKHGGYLDILLSAERVTMDDQESWLKMFLDVTERHRTQESLMRSIEAVMTDADWLGREVVERLAQMRGGERYGAPLDVLSPREQEVIGHLAVGSSDQQIADLLGLTRKTVSNHVANIYGKIGVHSRIEAALWARGRGLGE